MKLDKKEMKTRAASYGRAGFGLAVKAGILYAAFILLGLVGGGAGGWWGAAHLGWSGWSTGLCAFLGIVAGGVAGFFLAQIAVLGIIQDMLLDAGIKAGKVGYRAGMKLLREKRAAQQQKNSPANTSRPD
jgi:hypothetical protein